MDWIVGMALVLGVMILVHEWGHFIVARLFGVRVDVFSIGFGPRLFGWKRGATDYRLSLLPLGGYVRMAGQDLSEIDSSEKAPTGSPDELMSKPRWQRALISFAGPAVNLLFPIVLLTGYFVAVGIPYPSYQDLPLQVTGIPAQAVHGNDGLHAGDKVVSLNGVQNPDWDKAEKVIIKSGVNSTVSVTAENSGVVRRLELPVDQKAIDSPERIMGFAPIPPVIEEVASGMPADRAGLRADDKIVGVDGQKIQWWGQFTERVRGSHGQPLNLEIDRQGQQIKLVVAPQPNVLERNETVYQIGVQVHTPNSYRRVSFPEAVRTASAVTAEKVAETVGVVAKLFSGRVSIKQLQGPVGISHEAAQAVRKGPLYVISLMVLISVNLGILNLLPIPILDGGNILLLAIEGVRRQDLSLSFKERFVQVGLVLLLVLFAVVMYHDVLRRLPIHS